MTFLVRVLLLWRGTISMAILKKGNISLGLAYSSAVHCHNGGEYRSMDVDK